MKKITQKHKKPILYALLGVAFVGVAGSGYHMYSRSIKPVEGAAKTIQFDNSQMKSFKDDYGTDSKLYKVLNHPSWNGRNTDLVVKVNDGNLTKADKNDHFMKASTMRPYRNLQNGFNERTISSELLLNNEHHTSVSKKQTAKTEKIISQNQGKLNILKDNRIMPAKYMEQNDEDSDANALPMTEQTKLAYDKYVDNTVSSNSEHNDKKASMLRVIAVYRDKTDSVPVGYQVQSAVVKNPQGGLGKHKTSIDKDAMNYNVYIRNVQEGYKINYSNGRVSYQ